MAELQELQRSQGADEMEVLPRMEAILDPQVGIRGVHACKESFSKASWPTGQHAVMRSA